MFMFIKLPNRIISYDCVKTMLVLKRKWIKKILVFRDIAFAAHLKNPYCTELFLWHIPYQNIWLTSAYAGITAKKKTKLY